MKRRHTRNAATGDGTWAFMGSERIWVPEVQFDQHNLPSGATVEPLRGYGHTWAVMQGGQCIGWIVINETMAARLNGERARYTRNAAPGDFVPNELNPIDFRYNDPPDENGESIRYGRWEPGKQGSGIDEEPRQWYEVNYASGSDYSGGSVHESNYKELENLLEEAHPEGSKPAVWATAYGGHGTYAILVVYAELDESIQETLSALDEYPLISEEAHSALEMEQQDEAWSNWARSEFEKEFLKAWNENWPDDEEVEDWPEGFDSRTLFEAAREVANEYWEDQQGSGQYIDLKPIAETAVGLLAGETAVPSWVSVATADQLIEIALALGMERDAEYMARYRERRGQQRIPGIKNS